MPTGKARSGKRSTGALSSTTTVVIFVALSALALWLFSSNSFGPLQTTSKASEQTPSEVATTVRSENAQDHSKPSISEIHQGHEDIPTEAALPVVDPGVKSVDNNDRSNQDDKKDFVSSDSTGKPEEKVLDNIDRNSEASLKHQKEEQEKQMALETQTSEESSFTHREEVEQTAQQNPQQSVKGGNEDQGSKEKQDEKGSKADGVSETKLDEKGLKDGGVSETKLDEKGSKDDGISETKLDEKGSKADGTTEMKLDEKGSKVDGTSEMKPDEKGSKVDSTSEMKLDDKGSKVDGASETKADENGSKVDGASKTKADENGSKVDGARETKVDENGSKADGSSETKLDEKASKVDGNSEMKSDETGSKADGTSETSSKNDITDEDQRKRVEEHQKQEENQVMQGKQSKDPHGAVSDDQIQHDEATEEGKNPEKSTDGNKNSTSTKKNDNDPASSSNGEIPKESSESKKSWKTQADQSVNEKERRREDESNDNGNSKEGYKWQLCNETAGADYIPCLDNEKAIAKIHKRKHYEHRERHCPEEPPTCLVPLPQGYKKPIKWPQSRDKIWYANVPHTLLADVKGHQNWVKRTGEFLSFPGGGTQFIHGALHYIDFIQQAVPDIEWGKHTRVVLDVGCGVASFGGFLFERDVLTMSFAPKDEHEAQVQFALERGIPAISAVMGSQRLPFPSRVFDLLHCARCRVPWHADGGSLLLELNRVLRPGGYFVWSATPVYQKLEEDVQIWEEMSKLTVAMCWDLVTIKKDKLNSIGAAIYKKPDSNDCYEKRKKKEPPMCKDDDDSSASWYVPLQSCMHSVPFKENERGSRWPEEWPERMQTPPFWLNKTQMGIYGKPAPDDFASDYQHWKKEINKTYVTKLGIDWSEVRNVMDMRAVYGGFAAALKDMKVWVMNVVNVDAPDTLPIIYERGLFGIYHDWCESFSTYPRSYDLVHADHLLLKLQKRCKLEAVMAEIDRIVRPGGKLIVRDESDTVGKVENLLKSLHWVVKSKSSKNREGIISAEKTEWRPPQS